MAEIEGDGRAFRAISLVSTIATTSFTGFARMSGVPSSSRRRSESYTPFRRTSRIVGYKTSLLSARDYVTTFVIMVYTMCSRFIDCYQEFLF